jgi:hypothetical protein
MLRSTGKKHEKAKWRRQNLRHFFAGNQAGEGFFYSVNVELSGLRRHFGEAPLERRVGQRFATRWEIAEELSFKRPVKLG